MGTVGDRRRRRHHTYAMAAGLAALLALVAVGERDLTPPPPLPPRPEPQRDDLRLEIDADRDGGEVHVDLRLAVDRRGDPVTVSAWDDETVIGERLADGQVVLHIGIVAAGPDVPEDIDLMVLPPPPPPVDVRPGDTFEGSASFDGSGPERDAFTPARGDDVRRLDEVRVCLWEQGADEPGTDRPAICADDEL